MPITTALTPSTPSATTLNSWYWIDQTQSLASNITYLQAATATMFTPLGNGSLYYHAIPITGTSAIRYPMIYQSGAGSLWLNGQDRLATPRQLPRVADLTLRIQKQRLAIQRGRRALRKSIDLFRKFRPEAEIKAFLDGQPLIVRGHRFDYSMQKRGDLVHHTMHPDSPNIPYDLHVIDKITGKRLAKGCVVVPGAPVIDQLLALILHVQDPQEEEVVIHTTNWSPRLPDIGSRLARAA